ncbi:MAG: hypothetical protein JW938_07765 [Candidatus Omnitrophica bacterium]|nr:hypothetical protein [Candidatus Omnitrophota bacterium]
MKFVLRTFIVIVILGVMLALILHYSGRTILKHAIIAYFSDRTGFRVALDEAWVDLKNDTIVVKNFIVINPPEFNERVFADFERLVIRFDYRRFFRSTYPRDIVFPLIEYHARRFVIEKRTDGVTNLSLLKNLKPIKTAPKPKSRKRVFLIERFVLSIKEVGYVDHTKMIGKYKVFRIDVNNKVYENIDELSMLGKIAVMEIVKGTTLDKIPLGIDMDDMNNALSPLTERGITFGSKTLDKGVEVSEDFFSSVQRYATDPFAKMAETTAKATHEFFEDVGYGVEKLGTIFSGKKTGRER